MTIFINTKPKSLSLTKVTTAQRSHVIRQYLHAQSMNEIVKETFLSKGTVNNIIQEWKARINGTDIEEIRGFIAEVRKSGMSLQECAQTFRIANTLKKFNVYDEFDEEIIDDDYDGEKEMGPLTKTGQKKHYGGR